MIGIDTNVLVRFFTKDDSAQFELASKFINKYLGKKDSIFINNIVICELIWVLLYSYKYSKFEVINLLHEMLAIVEFKFEDYNFLVNAVIEFEETNADFPDILIGLLNKEYGCSTTITFDNKASNLKNFELLT